MVAPIYAADPSPEVFYATNNQFLVNGSKGFSEMKMLENDEMFMRLDLPGVPEEGLKVSIHPSKKFVCVDAEAPKVHKHDSSHRKYESRPGITCKCCVISSFTSHMCDGVLRLVLSKTNNMPQHLRSKGPHKFPHGSDPNDPEYTGRLLMPHPCVLEGSMMAYESKQLQNGSLYLRVDMPGVPVDNFTVSVENGRVRVTGEAPVVSQHDQGGRFYSGEVAMLSTPVDFPSRRMKYIAKDGVLRLLIPPL